MSSHVDADGVRIEKRAGVRVEVWLIVLAVAIIGVLLVVRSRPEAPAPDAVAHPAPVPASHRAALEPRRPPVVPDAPVADAPALPPNDPEPAPNPANPVFSQAAPGEVTGMALYPPMGSDPLKTGVLVPDGFELPEGYVRHYQTTDDGEQLPPILMFHPDYRPTGESGEPIALPADRIVPPEMVPSGMPVEMLQLPEDDRAPAAAP